MGGWIYTTSFPCLLCMKMLVQCGLKRIVFQQDYDSELSKELVAEFKEIEIVMHKTM